jgi:hypothetical protein
MHTGPALTSPQYSDILLWIQSEREAATALPEIESAPYMPLPCTAGNPGDATCPINSVDLAALGEPGTFEFVAMGATGGYVMSGMQFKAGADGLYIAHPKLISHPAGADPVPDPTDRFFNTVLNIAPNATGKLGTGTETVTFSLSDPISIHFDAYEKFHSM